MTIDTINLRFAIKTSYSQQQLLKMTEDLKESTREMEKTKRAMDKLSKNGLKAMTEEQRKEFNQLSVIYSDLSKKTHEQEVRMQEYTRTVKINDMSIQQLAQRARDLTAVIKNIDPRTDEFMEYSKELQQVRGRMKELNDVAKETQESLEKTGGGFMEIASKSIVALNAALQIFDRVKGWMQPFIDEARRYSDVVADVAKYTGQSINEVRSMNDELSKIDTRSSIESLNELAGAAGRLGISAEKDIIGFVDAADKINTALGDDLGEGAIDAIGKMTMVFGEDKTKGLNGAMLATGSALNVLGASSSANTGYIADFTSKLAAMAKSARLSQTDIMGYASALSQAGETGEGAAGVFAQFVIKMFRDPAKFAHAASLDVKAFTDLIKTDANQAIMQFLDAVRQKGGFENVAPMLAELKMQGTNAVPVITELANGLDNIRKAQQDASEAYEAGTSIIDEFNQVNTTAQAQHEKNEKALQRERREIGERLLPVMDAMEATQVAGLRTLSGLVTVLFRHRAAIATVAAAVAAYAAVQAVSWAWEHRLNAERVIGNVLSKTSAALTAAKTVVVSAYNVVVNRMQGHTIAAARAQLQLNAAMNANVFGAIAAAITAVVVVGKQLYDRLTDIGEATRTMNEAAKEARTRIAEEQVEMQQLTKVVYDANASEDDRKRALEEINGKLMQQHLGNINEEMIRTGKAKLILDQYNRSMMLQIENEILLGKIKEARARQMNAENGEFDTSFLDDAKAFLSGLGGYYKNILMPGSNPFKGFKEGWNNAMEDTRQDILKETQTTIDALQQKIDDNRNKMKVNNDQIFAIGDVEVVGHVPDSSSLDPFGSSGKGGKSGSNKDKTPKELQQERDKLAYDRQLADLKQSFSEKKITEEQYHQQTLAADTAYLAARSATLKKYGATEKEQVQLQNDATDAVIKEANRQRSQQQKQMNDRLAQADRDYAAEIIAIERARMEGDYQTEEQYNTAKTQAELVHQARRLQIVKEGNGDVAAAQQAFDQAELATLKDAHQRQQREYEQHYQAIATAAHKRGGFTGDDLAEMRNATQQAFDQNLISYQQYQQRMTEIARTESEQRKAIQQQAIDATQQLLQSSSALFSALQQRETQQVDAKYKKLIAAAKKQGKDTTKLEEQQEAEKQAIQKKYAQKQFQLQVLQIISNTAMGISKVWSEWAALPAVAAALTALTVAQGAIQLATAKAQMDAAAGLYKGGYNDEVEGFTANGNPNEPAGFIPVHKREFVANHLAVQNPQLRPVFDVIDRHQRLGNVQMLNATRLLEEAYGQGRYHGGFTNAPGTATDEFPIDGSSAASPFSGGEALPLLREIADNTAQSLTVRSLRDEIARQERMEKNARR